jgi:hypothetical protein
VDGDIVFFRGTGESEWVILPERYFWAAEEDVLYFIK